MLKDGRALADGPVDEVLEPSHVAAGFGIRPEVLRSSSGSKVLVF